LEESKRKYQEEIREKLMQNLKKKQVEDPELVLESIEAYCEIILRTIFKEHG
jgi:hypothetical protein